MKQIYYVIQTLLRGRGSNIIKIISLGLSLTMSILLFSRVAYEQSFDTCYKDYDNLYQIWSVFTVKGEKYPPQEQNCGPVAGAILENFPEQVEAATSTCHWMNAPLYNENARFDERKIVADSLFFKTMGIEVLSGNPVKDLQQPNVIFLSDRFAGKIFGGENPVGKTVNYNHEKDFTVKGTYEALPENATVHPEAVISMPTLWNDGVGNYSWRGGDSYPEYIRFRPGADKSVVNARIDAMIEKYRPEEDKKKYGYTAFVKPIRDTYRNYESVERMRNIMTVLGLAILFIAALNYVLISISSLTYRAKAVGVHKCNGASGGKIFGMFLLETGIIIAAALLLMALVLLNFREFFEDTAAAKLSLLLAPERIWVPLTVVGILFMVGGVLPGRLFARIPVSQVFRRYTEGKKGWKRPLLFIQFAGVAFICGLMCVVMVQYQYVLQIGDFTEAKMPFVARYNQHFTGTVHVRLKEPFVQNLRQLNKDAADAFGNQTIDFVSYEKQITDSYNSVRVFRNATLMAAVTMFFVMLMGLIGYTADEVRRRGKEIAIRKVNGAEASSILELLSKDVLVVALPAVVLGTLASWYINGIWMEQFAEQVPLGWVVYLLVVIANLAVIVGCVLWKSWRIANENPVSSIKSE